MGKWSEGSAPDTKLSRVLFQRYLLTIFCGTELENGFEKKQTFHNILVKAFIPKSLYSEECQRKKLSVVCCEMFAFFKRVFVVGYQSKGTSPRPL